MNSSTFIYSLYTLNWKCRHRADGGSARSRRCHTPEDDTRARAASTRVSDTRARATRPATATRELPLETVQKYITGAGAGRSPRYIFTTNGMYTYNYSNKNICLLHYQQNNTLELRASSPRSTSCFHYITPWYDIAFHVHHKLHICERNTYKFIHSDLVI